MINRLLLVLVLGTAALAIGIDVAYGAPAGYRRQHRPAGLSAAPSSVITTSLIASKRPWPRVPCQISPD